MRGRSVLRRSAVTGISFQLYADAHIFQILLSGISLISLHSWCSSCCPLCLCNIRQGSAGRSSSCGCSATDAQQWKESSCSELCFLKRFALHSCYLYTFGFLCILIVCSNFVTVVSVSPLSPSIFPFATITLFAALINQITNNHVSCVFGFDLQQITLFFLGFAILGSSQLSEFMLQFWLAKDQNLSSTKETA